jgi:hypothetical protein
VAAKAPGAPGAGAEDAADEDDGAEDADAAFFDDEHPAISAATRIAQMTAGNRSLMTGIS